MSDNIRSPTKVRKDLALWIIQQQTHANLVLNNSFRERISARVTDSSNKAVKFIHSFTDACSPGWTFGLHFRGFLITHIQTHGRTPLDEWSDRRRGLYLHRTTQHINTTDKHPYPSGIRTRDPSNQVAADLRLRSRGHWDRRLNSLLNFIKSHI
jgi:hypothetical protein